MTKGRGVTGKRQETVRQGVAVGEPRRTHLFGWQFGGQCPSQTTCGSLQPSKTSPASGASQDVSEHHSHSTSPTTRKRPLAPRDTSSHCFAFASQLPRALLPPSFSPFSCPLAMAQTLCKHEGVFGPSSALFGSFSLPPALPNFAHCGRNAFPRHAWPAVAAASRCPLVVCL